MRVSVMIDKFHEWLDECPVQWISIKNGKHNKGESKCLIKKKKNYF